MKKRNAIFLLIWLSIVCCSIWYFSTVIYPKRVNTFHEKEIAGIIAKVSFTSGGLTVRLQGSEQVYHHLYINKKMNYATSKEISHLHFDRFVEIGDSIYKAPFDDYIRVFREGAEFGFKTIKEEE